ncbi:MAG: hypothetical protein WC592_02540 [Candidatus Omnitrophota bacterium]
MKKILLLAAIIVISVVATTAVFARRGAIGPAGPVPRVSYIEPKNDSTVDLSGKDLLTFRWNNVPMPGGGRESFRFTLYKGRGYDVLVKKVIDERTFSIEVPSDMFEDGREYSWRVMQRDGKSMAWSRYDIWYFRVNKKR